MNNSFAKNIFSTFQLQFLIKYLIPLDCRGRIYLSFLLSHVSFFAKILVLNFSHKSTFIRAQNGIPVCAFFFSTAAIIWPQLILGTACNMQNRNQLLLLSFSKLKEQEWSRRFNLPDSLTAFLPLETSFLHFCAVSFLGSLFFVFKGRTHSL